MPAGTSSQQGVDEIPVFKFVGAWVPAVRRFMNNETSLFLLLTVIRESTACYSMAPSCAFACQINDLFYCICLPMPNVTSQKLGI